MASWIILSDVMNLGYMHRNELDECMNYVCKDLFTKLELVMIGECIMPEKAYLPGTSLSNVAEELKMFGKECE